METLYFLAWKEILVRYKLAVFGISWALFRPLISAFVFSFLFKSVGEAPYALFALTALLPWQFFSSSLLDMTPSVLNQAPLITKVYFPRCFVPISLMMVNGVDFLVTFSLVLFLSLLFKGPSLALLLIPFLSLQLILLTLGGGLFLSAMTVKYRDIRFLVPFFIQLLFFLSPVAYDISIVPIEYRGVYSLNPLVGLIEGFRFAFLSLELSFYRQVVSFSVSVLIFFLGFTVFQRQQRAFADAL